MPFDTFKEIMDREGRRRMALPGAALPQLLPLKPAPAPRPTVSAKDSEPAEIRTAQRTQIPATYISLEPKPLSAYNDDGVLNEQGAASVLGDSAEQMKIFKALTKSIADIPLPSSMKNLAGRFRFGESHFRLISTKCAAQEQHQRPGVADCRLQTCIRGRRLNRISFSVTTRCAKDVSANAHSRI
jgi:hypothetical protein